MTKNQGARRIVADNRKARHNYFVEEELETGIVLQGTEVKALRAGATNVTDAYAEVRGNEVYLLNMHIPVYEQGNRFNHDPLRPRKLLLHRREISRLLGATQRKGLTLIPLSLYFNDKGRAKVKLGLCKGKKLHDKRATEKDRDWAREKSRLMKENG
ncbi:MAG: SsrA-binding protein [Kordiimonas sp.]|nr:SsrA-binding protein [Kordiimonas sp.]